MYKPLVKARKISISVAKNDPIDIRCGGPAFLGFDFVVEAKTQEYWRKFIWDLQKVKSFPMWNCSIERAKDFESKIKIWTEAQIIEEVKNYSI